jgi:hypothetical protein
MVLPPIITRPKRRRRGSASAELVLILPIVFLFFISLITLVQAFIIRNAAENAAYAGARRAIIPGVSEASIRRVIAEEMRLGLVSIYQSNIDGFDDSVRVTVTVPFNGNAWATGGYMPRILSIQQSCTLQEQVDEPHGFSRSLRFRHARRMMKKPGCTFCGQFL